MKKLIFILLTLIVFSCDKSETDLDKGAKLENPISSFKTPKDSVYLNNLSKKIYKSEEFIKLLELKEKNTTSILIKPINLNDINLNSEEEALNFLKEYYTNPEAKLQEIVNIHSHFRILFSKNSELLELNSSDLSFTIGKAINLRNLINNKKAHVGNAICNCKDDYNDDINSARRQFYITSAGCALTAPGIWTFFACEAVAGAIHDEQFATATRKYQRCLSNC